MPAKTLVTASFAAALMIGASSFAVANHPKPLPPDPPAFDDPPPPSNVPAHNPVPEKIELPDQASEKAVLATAHNPSVVSTDR